MMLSLILKMMFCVSFKRILPLTFEKLYVKCSVVCLLELRTV